jgi:hypothetical protein
MDGEPRILTQGRSFHLSQSIRGLLHYSDRELRQALKWITKDDGSRFASPGELREALMDELAKGHVVLPTGECEGFDPKLGCPGHPSKSPA